MAPCLRFKKPELLSEAIAIPDKVSQDYFSSNSSGRLDGLSGHQKCVFPYSSVRCSSMFCTFFYAGNHFQFRCLPFGLSLAPWTFTKVLVTVIAYLQQRGIRIFHHLEDVLILAPSEDLLLWHWDQVLTTLMQFGWRINMAKSQLTLCQTLVYLGMSLNTLQYKVFLPQDKIICVSAEALKLGASPMITVHRGMRFLGILTACIPAVPWAQ